MCGTLRRSKLWHAERAYSWERSGAGARACLDAALAWACLPGNQSQPQAMKIERLGTMPGAGGAWEAASRYELVGSSSTLA